MSTEQDPLLQHGGGEQNQRTVSTNLRDADHPLNPMNMPYIRKWLCVAALGAMTFAATFSSSVFNAAIPATAKEFHVSPQKMGLSTSLFVFGFATGPIIMGPTSEVLGRKIPLFAGYLAFVLSQIPVGLSKDANSVLISRFISGVASAGSPAIVGGYLADFLAPVDRGIAVAIFAAMTLIGPEIGAISGAILVNSSLGWRWTAWVSLILGVVFAGGGFFILPETYVPVLEQRYANKLRKQGIVGFEVAQNRSNVNLQDFVKFYLTRPILMLCFEPILFLTTIYISFVFGLLYLLFVAYPISFVKERGFSPVGGTLPLLAVCVGIVLGAAYAMYYTLVILKRKQSKKGKLDPEDRLPPMVLGAVLLALGLFWFAATSSPDLDAWFQILSGVPIGFGIQVTLLQSLAYLIDIYLTRANSAISGTVIVRSLIGGLFPLLGERLYSVLSVFWASIVLGSCALVLAPIPALFYLYGAKIRSSGKYTQPGN